ncbi:MAG: ATP-binding domain-containing protein [Myxococcales bacterium]|nr:ATP-binding domain-containing protein [Myxococcales bacterium]
MSEVVKEGSASAKIVEEEVSLHEQVQERVRQGATKRVEHLDASGLDRDLIELRDAIAEAKPEDLAPLVEQMTRLAAIRGRLGKGKDLPIDMSSPYFAHMVLKEGKKVRDVLIGKRGFIDRQSNVQIVDWRNAPISQVYYRYDEGDDYDEEVQGLELSGIVELKRNVSIQHGNLRRIGTLQGTFIRDREGQWHEASGDSAPVLQGGSGKAVRAPKKPTVSKHGGKGDPRGSQNKASGALGVHGVGPEKADKHLPEIAALIDKEQFDLISQPESGMVVIQGGAGSGKTTVALHRVAFLNFADRQRFKPSKMLFVVPSKALVRYVDAVLPSLGVRGVPVMTYTDWASRTRKRLLRGTKGKYNHDTPDNVVRVKKHPALLSALERYVAGQVAEAEEEFSDLGAGEEKVIEEWQRLHRKALVPRLRSLYKWLRSARLSSETRFAAENRIKGLGVRANDSIEDWADVMTDFTRLWAAFENTDVSRRAVEATVRWCTAQDLESPIEEEEDEGPRVSDLDGRTLDEASQAGLFDTEDDPILLRLIQLKRGSLSSRKTSAISYSHVAIDEAQDRSAIEVKVLLDATESEGPNSEDKSVTIAGDTAQRIVFDNDFGGWEQLLRQTGNKSVTVSPLKLSYRSTAEVMALAREVLGPELAPKEDLIARSGAPVELHQFGDAGEAVAFLGDALRALVLSEPAASVVVLTRYPEQADVYYNGLRRAEVPRLRRVQRDEFSFEPGIDVTDARQVKGLEFDYVIMVDVNTNTYPETDECRHLMHIAATRAAYQLWLVSTAEPSHLLPESLRDF